MQNKTAAIINVGYELTTGKTLNTHAQYLSKHLNLMGYHLRGIICCADVKEDIADALEFYKNCDLVLLTGGLGPTVDDITRDVVAAYYNLTLIQDDDALIKLKSFFSQLHIPMTNNNLKQAMFPASAMRIINDKGTADAFGLKIDKQHVFALPGPPSELRHIFNKIMPLIDKGKSPIITTLKIFGVGESTVDDAIGHLLINNASITSGIYAENSEISIRFLRWVDDDKTKQTVDESVAAISQHFKNQIFATEDITLPALLLNTLKTKALSISFAESCTGGLLAKAITDLEGASSVFNGSVVTYSNAVKTAMLGVPEAMLVAHGAVSKQVCSAMLKGLGDLFNASVNIAVTGIAGPGGGTPQKPVGRVYIGISYLGNTSITEHNFHGDRQKIRQRTLSTAYFNALKLINQL